MMVSATAKAVAFAGELVIGHVDPALLEPPHHAPGLLRRHHLVIKALEQDDGRTDIVDPA
mgnify:CR=1 FL=1